MASSRVVSQSDVGWRDLPAKVRAAPMSRREGESKILSKAKKDRGALVPRSIPVCLIAKAILALMNTSVKSWDENKGVSSMTTEFDNDVLTTMRGMFPSNKTYRFQVHTNSTISSSGAGVVQVASPANPAVVTYAEWSALAALFDECKLIRSQLGLTSSSLVASKAIPLWIAFDHVTSTAVGTGFGNVQRLAGSKCINSLWMNGGGGRHIQSTSIAGTRLYASTASTTSTSSDIGLNGQWDISGQDNTTNSVVVAYGDVCNVISFRNRA